MSKSKFTEEQKAIIDKLFSEGTTITDIARHMVTSHDHKSIDSMRRRVGNLLSKKNSSLNRMTLEQTQEFKSATSRELSSSKYYIVTWLQNGTPVHKEFWNNILAYKKFLNAELSVILGRYKNPTSVFADRTHETWDKTTEEYWDASTHDIHKYLTLLSGVKISPTAKYPLTGIQGLARHKSIIVGHPKIHLKVEPTIGDNSKKVLFTTGAVSIPNYTDSKAGAIAAGAHKFGFIIIEIKDEEVFFLRQIEAQEDGSFIDICHEVTNSTVTVIEEAEALICGDIHADHIDPKIDKQNDIICNYFNVKHLVVNDLADGGSANHWIDKNPIEKFKRYKNGGHLIKDELDRVVTWLEDKVAWNVVVPQANHNRRFDKTLLKDWREDIPNSDILLEYTLKALNSSLPKGVLADYVNRYLPDVLFLEEGESYMIGKYECGLHGDIGTNGTKGSPRGFRNLEIPIILGHSHTAYRADDCLYVGTNTHLKLDYNVKGASTWIQANVLINKYGIAQHIIFVRGEFTTFKPLQ